MYCKASSLPYHQTLVRTWTTPAPSLHRSQYDKPLEVHITGTPTPPHRLFTHHALRHAPA